MGRNKIKHYLALEYFPGITSNARVDKRDLGTPLRTVMLPKNRRGIDFAAMKRALRKNEVIFSLNSCDGKEFIEFALIEDYYPIHRGPTTKPGGARCKTK